MSELSFTQLSNQIQEHFANGTFDKGLSLASEQMSNFPNDLPLLNYWRICLAARLNEIAMANKLLESTLGSGIWYSEVFLRQSPSLETMQGEEEFERLIEISLQMKTADPIQSIPMLVIRPENACGPEEESCPAAIFLHGNQDTAKNNMLHWQSLSNEGWLVGLPQTSSALWADAYIWTDYVSASEEVQAHFTRLNKEYNIDQERVILAGISMGAEVGLAMVLDEKIKAKGFVLLGPGGPFMNDLDKWKPFIDKSKNKGLRGVILMGLADDTIPQENVRQLVKTLNQNGIICDLKTYPNLEHEYPDDFENVLQESLKFIFKKIFIDYG